MPAEKATRQNSKADSQRQTQRRVQDTAPMGGGSSLLMQQTLADPLSASPAAILSLQRTHGNQAVQRLINHAQRKASVGMEGGEVDGELQSQIEGARGGGRPMDSGVATHVGAALGADFTGVRVHTDPNADTLNRSLSAKAFTHGSDIFFSKGAYNPGTHSGKQLLAHELTHVAQQGAASGTGQRKANKVQTKLTVSPAGDQYEQEADRVAEQVMTMPGPQVSPVQRAGNEEEVQTKLLRQQPAGAAIDHGRDGHQPACGCAACASGIQRQATDDDLQLRHIQRKQTDHAAGCNCAACGGPTARVQRTTVGVQAKAAHPVVSGTALSRVGPRVQRHSSWEHRALGDIKPDDLAVLGTYQEMAEERKKKKKFGKKLNTDEVVVHVGPPLDRDITMTEFLHVMDQEINRLKTFRDHPPQQADAAAEEKLRQRFELRQARKELEGQFGRRQFRQKTRDAYQEAFQEKLAEIQGGDRWQVRLVAIKHRNFDTDELTGEQTIITYGEMNTLGDFVGDPKQLEHMTQENLQRVINGIRQQSMIRFMRMRDTVKGKWNRNKNYWGQGFDKASGATGRGLLADINIGSSRFGKLGSEGQGQLRLMLSDKVKVGGKAETDYTSGLARNACHFAPESWITWEKYHRQAIDLARDSVRLRGGAGAQGIDEEERQNLNEQADEAKRQAIIQNGFGDHFLQDSYAAGHLINKDEIMKWYTLWLANDSDWNQAIAQHAQPKAQGGANKTSAYAGGINVRNESGIASWRRWDYMTDKTSKKRVAMAKQTGLGVEANRYDINNVGPGLQGKNMQAVENMTGTWQERFEALGLQLPPSLDERTATNMVFKEWQRRVASDKKYAKITPSEFSALTGLGANLVQRAFAQFATDVVAEEVGKRGVLSRGDTIYEMRKTFRLTGSGKMKKGQVPNPTDVNAPDYTERAQKAVYKDYHDYMNTAALQAATNILHDHFCETGLYVRAANGDFIGKVYGDDAMFKKESAGGARYAGETSNMSHDSIVEMADADPAQRLPPEPVDKTTDIIKGRFPTHVTTPGGGSAMRLDNWHTNGPLKLLCDRVIFPAANRNFWKTFVGGGKAALTTGLAPKISKDVDVHQGDLF